MKAKKPVAEYLKKAISIVKSENPEKFDKIAKDAEGKVAYVTVEDEESFTVAVSKKGEVKISKGKPKDKPTGVGIINNSTFFDILDGKQTPLEAFFRADLTANANSRDLHLAYDVMTRGADLAIRSKKLQDLIDDYRESRGIK